MWLVDKWTTDLFFGFLRSQLLCVVLRLLRSVQPARAPYRGSLIVAGDSLAFPQQLAAVIGTNEALILQKFHEWIEYNEWTQKRDHFIDGRWWTYNTYDEWQEKHFYHLSVSTVKRLCKKMEKMGVLLSGRHAKSATDQTKWYAIDYQKLSTLLAPAPTKRVSSPDQKSLMGRSKESNDSNKESAITALNHKNKTSTSTARAQTPDGDDDLTHDSGEENFVPEKPSPRFEEKGHESSAPDAPVPSSAAPLPHAVQKLIDFHALNPVTAAAYVQKYGEAEAEKVANVVEKSTQARSPAGLWRALLERGDYKQVQVGDRIRGIAGKIDDFIIR